MLLPSAIMGRPFFIWSGIFWMVLASRDLPRWQVPATWQSPLSLSSGGDFRIEKQGDLTLKYVTARLGDGGLEVVPVRSVANTSRPVRSVDDIANRFSGATRRTVLAAVNGGFFDMASGLPVGFLLRDGEMEFFNMPQGVVRSMVGFGETIQIASPQAMPKVWLDTARGSLGVHHINVPGGKNAFGVFTPLYESRLQPSLQSIVLLAERRGITAQRYVIKERLLRPSLHVPANHILIVLQGNSRAYASALSVGSTVRLRWTLPPSWNNRRISHGLLAGPRLLKAGALRVTAKEERLEKLKSPDRMALGVKSNGDVLLLWVHRENSGNVSFEELAQLLQTLGAIDAIGLDGGRSRAILAQSPAPYFEGGRPVANALVVAQKAVRKT